ncbi:hypothetical protein BGZ70_010053 [Mortierella alpina]|uniref:Pre-rRNA processing protein n=1 Tax=Mortierella alpina TaxID=64518 RepID=A0A9P6J0G2_MORAP|nr:hypothetical protein BGZ70_010053 [Mortierella alpina]
MAFDIREDDEDRQHDEFDEYEDVKQPARPKFYRRRKFWICCIPTTIIGIIVAVILALYVIMPKIAQGLMNKASIEFSQIDITNPSATSMDIVMQGDMKETGPFHAEISFPGIVTVSWEGKELGTTEIPGKSEAAGGSGKLDLQSKFAVTNAANFAEFSGFMLNAESFVWHLEGKLNVKALGHTVKDLDLSKDIVVRAFNGLSGIKIEKFSLPGDDPSGKGILIEIDTTVTNPSAIQMYMGSLTLAISYKDIVMGYVTSSGLTMVRGPQILSMKGVLIPQTTPEGLAAASEMMSRYIGNVVTDTIATGFDVKPDGVTSVEWLSTAVKNLKLTVPLQSPAPLQLIKALNLGALGLVFTPPTAYSPTTTSTGVLANYTLPDGFGFKVQFTQVANSFTLIRNGVTIASVNSSYNPSTSNMAAGTMTFNLLETPLLVPDESHTSFQEFNRDLTVGSILPFQVVGQASVFANTSIGTVNLVNIPFNASTELSGLQSLANPAPTITALQVVEGTSTALTMAISVVIVNPSSISLSAGDIVLDLMYKGVRLGTVTMPQLAIVPGANTVQTTSTIDPAASPEGLELLNLYTSGAGADVSIVGTPTSTQVESLSLAFGSLNIGTQMPGLQTKLLAGASLVVLDTTLVNGLAQTVVTVNNPFVPPMTILSIDTSITYNGVSLGTVVANFPSPPVIPGTGQGTITASLAMNTNPHDLVTLIRAQAVKNGLNTDAFDGLLSMQNGGNPPASLFEGFNVADFVVKAMAGLSVDIVMTTTVKVGDYQVTMPYTQTGVPTATDQTILKLIPIVGTPIAQLLVERSKLAFDAISILSPGETAFQTDIVGAITDTGPLDAQIQFPNPVTVSYGGKAIGTMIMPTVNAIANKGAALDLKGVPFTITDLAAFTDFNVFALNNAKFEWTIATTGLVVNAMGVALPGVTMTKTVTLDGFNKLEGLQISGYNITTIDDAGLHMLISASLANPSTIGMTIPVSTFQTQFHGKVLGPAVAEGLTLIPHGSSSFALKATISSGNGDLRPLLTGIFQNALAGVATPLDAQGTGAPGVSWLDTAIKSLLLHTSLPGLVEKPIAGVTIDAMSMDFTCPTCEMAPIAVSTISAVTNLPFVNGAPIVALSQTVEILDQNDQVVGVLKTPMADAVAKGNVVTTTTPEAPLVVAAASRDVYTNFIADLNEATKYNLGLRGTTDSVLNLGALGNVTIKGIKLDVKTQLDGLQGLKNIIYRSTIDYDFITMPGYIVTSALVTINNPSKLTLNLGDLTLNVGLDYTAAEFAGLSTLRNFKLVPGDNDVVSSIAFDLSTKAGQEIPNLMLTQDVKIALWAGDKASPNPALAEGLKKLRTSLVAPGGLPAVYSAKHYSSTWKIKVLPSTLTDGLVEMTATFGNPFFGAKLFFARTNSDNDINRVRANTPTDTTPLDLFEFLPDFSYELQPNTTITKTFKMKLMQVTESMFPSLDAVVANREALQMGVVLWGMLAIGADPTERISEMSSSAVYPPEQGIIPKLETGPDFLLDYYKKGVATATPTAIASPTLTATATGDVVTPAPTPTATAEPPVVTSDVPVPTATAAPSEEPVPVPEPTSVAPPPSATEAPTEPVPSP